MPVSDDDAALVLAVRGGDRSAFDALYRRWSDRCFDVARRIVHDDGRAAEVAQDVFLVAWNQLDDLHDPAAFGGWVLRMARNRSLNRLDRERRSTNLPGDAPLFVARESETARPDQATEAAMTAADHQELVAAATAVLGEREASVLDLHLRHGLSAAEIGEELGVTTNNAHQLLFRTKKKLSAGIRAWVLVRGGRPSCDELAAALDVAGVTAFGRPAQEVIDRHVDDCEACTRKQAAVLDPAALFATAPILVMAPSLRQLVTDGLRTQGVPVEPTPISPAPTAPGTHETGDHAGDDGIVGATATTNAPGSHDSRKRRMLVLAAILTLLAAVVGLVVLASGDNDDLVTTGTTAPPASTAASPDRTTDAGSPETTSTTIAAAPAPPGTATTAGTLVITPRTTVPPAAGPSAVPPSTFQPNPGTPATIAPAPPTPTTAPPPAPTVDAFTATSLGEGGSCPAAQWGTRLTWSTTHATTVTIAAATVSTMPGLPADGSRVVCRPTPAAPPGGWELTATGAGGSVSATA